MRVVRFLDKVSIENIRRRDSLSTNEIARNSSQSVVTRRGLAAFHPGVLSFWLPDARRRRRLKWKLENPSRGEMDQPKIGAREVVYQNRYLQIYRVSVQFAQFAGTFCPRWLEMVFEKQIVDSLSVNAILAYQVKKGRNDV